ncbi:MAG: 2,3-bisphosphoglycerate-independent phosphoglycerate mutase [Candidatus Eisenbacteria bacterium]
MGRPLILIVRDGWGIGKSDDPGNAIAAARTPNTDELMARFPHTHLGCAGEDVGLTPGSQGSSEVGHLNMGAGRIVEQEVVKIEKKIRDGSFFTDPALLAVIDNCKTKSTNLHFMGLVQDQGVHAMEEHLYALLELAKRQQVEHVYVHFFADGRDTPPRSAHVYLERLEKKMAELGLGRVASVMGRYYGMDRDRNWERTKLAYDALTLGKGLNARSAADAITAAYKRADAAIRDGETAGGQPHGVIETDEFIKPTLIVDESGQPVATIQTGDSVVFFNYRQDRAVQLAMAFVEKDFDHPGFSRGPRLDVCFRGFTRYYDSFKFYVIPPMDMSNILGEVLCRHGLWQLRISETQKFRHVTSFFNSKREEPFTGEERILIDSPKVPEETKPEMSAYEVTDVVLRAITGGIGVVRDMARTTGHVTLYEATPLESPEDRLSDTYDVIVLNYVNGDMVGHTGVFEAAVRAIEAVDECVGKVVKAVLARDGIALISADHGNAEQMTDPETQKIQTAHTLNEVDFIYCAGDVSGVRLRPRGILSDIAPTMLKILGITPPAEMTARSLVDDS